MIALDSNLLVYAHRAATREHGATRAAIDTLAAGADRWGIASACVAEVWCVATHPSASGRPSRPEEVRDFLDALVAAGMEVWSPRPGSGVRLANLATTLGVSGPRIFDLQIALTALEAGATTLWTHDRAFVSVPGLRTVDPLP